MVDLELRERRVERARRRVQRRFSIALLVAVLGHLLFLPLFTSIFDFEPAEPGEAAPVEMVRIPAADWDAALAEARRAAGESSDTQRSQDASERKPSKPEPEKEEPVKAPGQVVEVAPGNDEESPDARFAAE